MKCQPQRYEEYGLFLHLFSVFSLLKSFRGRGAFFEISNTKSPHNARRAK